MLSTKLDRQVEACYDIFKDLEKLGKISPKEACPVEQLPDGSPAKDRLMAIPLSQAMLNVLLDNENISKFGTAYGKQPFSDRGWKIIKFRFSFNKRSQSDGIRLIYAIDGGTIANSKRMICVLLYSKKPTPNESDIFAKIVSRLKAYLGNDT